MVAHGDGGRRQPQLLPAAAADSVIDAQQLDVAAVRMEVDERRARPRVLPCSGMKPMQEQEAPTISSFTQASRAAAAALRLQPDARRLAQAAAVQVENGLHDRSGLAYRSVKVSTDCRAPLHPGLEFTASLGG
jgi:hypothetical protein